MMSETTNNATEHDILVTLSTQREINAPWLEKQAIRIEEALEKGCPDILGPSVTANFEENGWELDLTIRAESMADAYDKLGQVFRIVEETAGVEYLPGQDEVRSGYASNKTHGPHETGELQPA
jgi:hypothetical protein